MNNKTGRPRNTAGSLYLRRDSRIWWVSYRDHNGKFRQESTGRKEKGEAEKVLRKQRVAGSIRPGSPLNLFVFSTSSPFLSLQKTET